MKADAETSLPSRFRAVRAQTEALAAPLSAEDMQVQSMPDASPTKWHLAHTTWFFETFVLAREDSGHRPFHPAFAELFNSYYESVGPRHPRPARGLLTRPSLAEVHTYRAFVDERVLALLPRLSPTALSVVELGLHHEQQHQELILTDVHHALAQNPLRPSYGAPARSAHAATRAHSPPGFRTFAPDASVEIGHAGASFAFDNEGPRHRVLLQPFSLATRLVTCSEYEGFIRDRGYERHDLWLSDGFAMVNAAGIRAPMYWEERDGVMLSFGLDGLAPIDRDAPVTHVSLYEADAYARWAGARLPTEAEWEHATEAAPGRDEGNFLESKALRAIGSDAMIGDAWTWTASAYLPYPRYRPAAGALGEYNGKFMSGQMVLRGASCFTPRSHARRTYRNFFPPSARWQMSGIRLAKDV
jgi:ergothioneine biosynthesis protein EgtB